MPLTNDIKAKINAQGAAPIFACRAWVNFNGTGTPVINASGNVLSITDEGGIGDYSVNFITPMPDEKYAVAGMAKSSLNSNSSYNTFVGINPAATPSTTSCRLRCISSVNEASASPEIGSVDPSIVCVSFFR